MTAAPEDAFLDSFIGSAALGLALKSGLVDRLGQGPQQILSLAGGAKLDPRGLELLAGLLESAGVLTLRHGTLALTSRFTAALPRRAALESKLAFLDLAARDVLDHLPAMLFDSGAYIGSGAVFELFRYDRAGTDSPEDLAFTRRWLDYTTALTEHEAPLLAPLMALGGTRRLLDIGGNSGAFVLALCAVNPCLEATVLDLPAVTELGRRYVAGTREAPRIGFVAADARRDPLPEGFDAISFKSVLHDWPEADARQLLTRARDALPSGGLLFIVERGAFAPGPAPLPYAAAANLAFARFYRPPSAYVDLMGALGLGNVNVQTIEIEMPFHVIAGTRP
jgi:SAM-dependent methyltransferase